VELDISIVMAVSHATRCNGDRRIWLFLNFDRGSFLGIQMPRGDGVAHETPYPNQLGLEVTAADQSRISLSLLKDHARCQLPVADGGAVIGQPEQLDAFATKGAAVREAALLDLPRRNRSRRPRIELGTSLSLDANLRLHFLVLL